MCSKQPKIAFLADGFVSWTGGVDFLRLCISGMGAATAGADQAFILLVPSKTFGKIALTLAVATKRRLFSLMGFKSALDTPVSREQLYDSVGTTGCVIEAVEYPGNRGGLRRVLTRRKIDVVLPCFSSPGRNFPFKWIGYYADLQHRRLPQNFSETERRKRDAELKTMLTDAAAILVPSKNVAQDIHELCIGKLPRLFPLPFCPIPNPEFLRDAPEGQLSRYGLPEQFFIISNQFWMHKSHETAFSALRLLRDSGCENAHIVCTGNTFDFRAPRYFDTLRAGIAEMGLVDRIRFLGMIPKLDQLAIMRRSVALIQPTLFEGGPGGLAVFDAVSSGTPALISDIPVNLEVDIGAIEFFRSGSAEDLADKMSAALRHPELRWSAEKTLSSLRARQKELGELLSHAISYVGD
jgi:glycosyltransferase involved in cell wall biosynthesis